MAHGIFDNVWYFRELNKVIDPLALVLQMEARVLEGMRSVHYRLPYILHLLLTRNHDLRLAGLVGQLDGELEDALGGLRVSSIVASLGGILGRAIGQFAVRFGCRVMVVWRSVFLGLGCRSGIWSCDGLDLSIVIPFDGLVGLSNYLMVQLDGKHTVGQAVIASCHAS